MQSRIFTLIIALSIVASACAQSKKTKTAKQPVHASVLEVERKPETNTEEGYTITPYRIVLVWKTATAPTTFYWRGEDGWMNCMVNKVRRKGKMTMKQTGWYTAAEISPEAVRRNDTLELIPVPGGRNPIPIEIPETAKNTVYYQLKGSSKWNGLAVKTSN